MFCFHKKVCLLLKVALIYVQVLLSSEAVHRWELQDVLGRGILLDSLTVYLVEATPLNGVHVGMSVLTPACATVDAMVATTCKFSSHVHVKCHSAGHQKSKACGILCHASWPWHGHQDRHALGEEGQGRCHGVLAGMQRCIHCHHAASAHLIQ